MELPGYGGTLQSGTLEVTLWGVGVAVASDGSEQIPILEAIVRSTGETDIKTLDFYIIQDGSVLYHKERTDLRAGKESDLIYTIPRDIPWDRQLTIAFQSTDDRVEFTLEPLNSLLLPE
jgi:hypothetical protein